MILEIVNLNTNKGIDDAFEMVFNGDLKFGAQILMRYTYEHAIVYDNKVYIDMYKAMDYIGEDHSTFTEEDAFFRVNMIDEKPVAMSLFIDGVEENVTYFNKVVL